ncbi:hypothetical protein ACFLS9_00595 [Bacteroidota bacterium]
MKLKLIVMIVPVLSMVIYCQIKIECLGDLPLSLKNKINVQFQDYNPLHIGDIWQYIHCRSYANSNIKIIKETVVNSKKYLILIKQGVK